MKVKLLAAAVLLVFLAPVQASPQHAGGDSTSIAGQWKIEANPPRFLKFNPDGTWTLMYLGRSDVQTGTWRIEHHTLHRTYASGAQRESEIVRLTRSEMVLKTEGQADTYQRLTAGASFTGPAKVRQ